MSQINPSIKSRLKSEKWSVKPISYYLEGILEKKDFYILSEAITLLESSVPEHREIALQILQKCYPHRTEGVRIGITGSPGVGKSTFIDAIVGSFTTDENLIGILTIDPSSTEKKGSILGDKTRMDDLVKDKSVFIRPSPTSTYLGGINQHTFEAMILCEAAGMNRIFVETVGVGQSEMAVSEHTDITVLLGLPGGGDSLQGIKKGVLEKADLVIINKSDGDSIDLARRSCKDLKDALHITQSEKKVPVIAYSALTGFNQDKVIGHLNELIQKQTAGQKSKRKLQEKSWLNSAIEEYLKTVIQAQLEQKIGQHIDSQLDQTLSPFDILANLRSQLSISISLKEED